MNGPSTPPAAIRTPASDSEVMEELRSDSPLNRARRVFSGWAARIDQAGAQRRPAGPIEIRRMEFEAVAEIAAALASENAAGRMP